MITMLIIFIVGYMLLVGLAGNTEYLICGIIFALWIGYCSARDNAYQNYIPPDGYEIDHERISRDSMNGVGKQELRRRIGRGYYNRRKKK